MPQMAYRWNSRRKKGRFKNLKVKAHQGNRTHSVDDKISITANENGTRKEDEE